jgi:hypothetical protein
VQTVLVVVRRRVDVDVPTSMLVRFPEVWVVVTGQRVVVVPVIIVVMISITLVVVGAVEYETTGVDSVT